MIYNVKNFIDQEVFDRLSKKTLAMYKISKPEYGSKPANDSFLNEKHGRYTAGISEQSCKRVRFWCSGDDVQKETVDFFGKDVGVVLDKLRQYLIDKGHPNIKLSNVWFQYGDMDTKMDRHSDGNIKESPFDKCFTSLLFLHPHWEQEWGGIFTIAPVPETEESQIDEVSTPFFPEPNSLVMWTRDHPHWMTPIVKECPLRMFIGMSWYE